MDHPHSLFRSGLAALLIVLGMLLLGGCGKVIKRAESNPPQRFATNEIVPDPYENMFAAERYADRIQGQTINLVTLSDQLNPDAIERFSESHQVKVVGKHLTNSAEFYALLESNEEFDVALLPYFAIERLIREDRLRKLAAGEIPALDVLRKRDLIRDLTDIYRENQPEFWAPYSWVTFGIVHNDNEITDLHLTWTNFFDHEMLDAERKKRIDDKVGMINDMRAVLGIALIHCGYSPNSTNLAEISKAKDAILKAKSHDLRYVKEGKLNDLVGAAKVHFALVTAADASQAKAVNPDIRFNVPDEGTVLRFNGFVVLKRSQRSEAAMAFINHMLNPHYAAVNANFSHWASASQEAKVFISRSVLSGPSYHLADEKAKLHLLRDLPPHVIRAYREAWREVMAEN